MSLFSSLYTGNSGLQTSQNALNTTAHNLANIDTLGYTRQQVTQADTIYNNIPSLGPRSQQIGLGVKYAEVRQVRDYFLDKTYRTEAGRNAYYENSYSIASEIETLLGEMEGVEFQQALSDFWTSIQELQKDPSNATNQGMLVNTADSFIERAQSVYDGMKSYQDTLNTQIKDTVEQINKYAKSINELNQKISAIEAVHVENANDYRDARNYIIDELAKLVKIEYDENMDGMMSVYVEGVPLVLPGYVNEMDAVINPKIQTLPLHFEVAEPPNSGDYNLGDDGLYKKTNYKNGEYNLVPTQIDNQLGFYTVVWKNYGNAEVFDFTIDVSAEKNTDIGGLKALVQLRGWDEGTFRSIPVKPEEPEEIRKPIKPVEDDYKNAAGEINETAYNAAMARYETEMKNYADYRNSELIYNNEVEFYNNFCNKSLLQNTMAEFDRLVNGIVTGMNEILNPRIKDGDGNDILLYKDGNDEIELRYSGGKYRGWDKDGDPVIVDISFDGKFVDSDTGEELTNVYYKVKGINLFQRRSIDTDDNKEMNVWAESDLYTKSWWSTSNLKVNPLLLQQYTYLGSERIDPYNKDSEFTLSMITKDGKEDHSKADALSELFSKDFSVLNPNYASPADFRSYYNNLVGEIATEGRVAKTNYETQSLTVTTIDSARQQVAGVSDSEELTNMIKFQNAYNAASRYITTVNSMISSMFNAFGVS